LKLIFLTILLIYFFVSFLEARELLQNAFVIYMHCVFIGPFHVFCLKAKLFIRVPLLDSLFAVVVIPHMNVKSLISLQDDRCVLET